MTTPEMKSKYHLLGLLGTLVVAGGLLLLAPAPDTQAQVEPEPPTIDKECTPNPVQMGQQLTCTIDVEAALNTLDEIQVTDNLPAGLKVTGATAPVLFNGMPLATLPCSVDGNTVTCPVAPVEIFNFQGENQTLSVTIEATAQQCGTLTNTATAEGQAVPPSEAILGGSTSFTVEDEEEITVVGCGPPPPPPPPGEAASGGPEVTQEVGQESESGEANLSFEVS